GESAPVPNTTATVTGAVQRSDGSPVANATVQLTGATTLIAQSDSTGSFIFLEVPYGEYRVVVNIKGLGQATREHIVIAGNVNVTVRYEPTSKNGLRIIAQVGTNTGAQVSTQPVSVTTITPQTFANQGEHTWRHILNEIPGVNIGTAGRWNETASMPDSPLAPQILQIGGALPYESTATLDGMPLSTDTGSGGDSSAFGGGGVDLSVYDPNAFSHTTITVGPGADSPSILN